MLSNQSAPGGRIRGGLLALALLTLVACSRDSATLELPPATPVIVISIDTLRSDRLPAYGYGGVETPAIDRLRADGVLFERAYSPVPLTLPAHASMMTGLLPPDHGVRDNIGYALGDEAPTLAESLQELGYRTGGAVSAFVLRRGTGIARGFEFYDDHLRASGLTVLADVQRRGLETFAAIDGWLVEVSAEPFFLFFHLYEPHAPYRPPPPFASLYRDPYDGEVATADYGVGKLLERLDELDLYQRSLIVLTSDHGEGLGEHGEQEHGVLVYRESLQVPLIFKLPAAEAAGSTISSPVQIADLTPTILRLLGRPPSEAMSQGSLLAPLDGEEREDPIYGETFYPQLRLGWKGLRSLILGRYHYIEGTYPELFDLRRDPAEQHNLIESERRIYGVLRERLDGYDPFLERPQPGDPAIREALLALGYIGVTTRETTEESFPDPRRRVHSLQKLDYGLIAYREGRIEAAIESLEESVVENPNTVVAWQFLGRAYQQTGRREKAYDALLRAFELSNGSPEDAEPLARAALEAGRLEEAVAYLQLVVKHDPDDLRNRLVRGRLLVQLGRLAEALDEAEEARRQRPENADAVYLCGAVKMGLDRLVEAESDLRLALSLAPDHTAAMSDLALLLQSRRQSVEARQMAERLLALQPGNTVAQRLLRDLNGPRQ